MSAHSFSRNTRSTVPLSPLIDFVTKSTFKMFQRLDKFWMIFKIININISNHFQSKAINVLTNALFPK